MDAYIFWKNLDSVKNDQSLKSVCQKLGIAYQRIADQRSDCRFPKLEDAYLIAREYNISLEFLLTGKNCHSSPEAQFVESNPEMKTLVRYCMNDGRLLSALQLIVEQARIEGERKIHA